MNGDLGISDFDIRDFNTIGFQECFPSAVLYAQPCEERIWPQAVIVAQLSHTVVEHLVQPQHRNLQRIIIDWLCTRCGTVAYLQDVLLLYSGLQVG